MSALQEPGAPYDSRGENEPTPIQALLQERDRKARIYEAQRTGARPSSADQRPDVDAFAQTPRLLLQVIGQARRLRATEHAYLWQVVAHCCGRVAYATSDFTIQTPPSLGEWAAWLGGWTTQQVYTTRRDLHDKRILTYVDDDPMRVALNPQWDEWDASVFDKGAARTGVGRPSKSGNLDGASKRDGMDESSSTQFTARKSGNLDGGTKPSIRQFRRDARQPAPQQAPKASLINKEIIEKRERVESNDSTADAVATAPLGGVPLTFGSSEPDEDGAASCSQGIYEIPTRLQVSGSEPLPRSAAPSPAAPTRAARKPAKAPAAPRKLTEDQQYRYALLTAVSEALDGAKTPNWGRDWKAAGWFYTKAQQHPASIEAVVACYQEMKQVPDWQVEYLHLDILTRRFDAYQKNPVNFHAWVVKQIKTDEWVRRKQQEEATGRPARPYPADALNTSVASTPHTIPVINPAEERRRDEAAWAAKQAEQQAAQRERMRAIAQRAGRDGAGEGEGGGTW